MDRLLRDESTKLIIHKIIFFFLRFYFHVEIYFLVNEFGRGSNAGFAPVRFRYFTIKYSFFHRQILMANSKKHP